MLLSGKRAQMEKIYYHLMAKYHLRNYKCNCGKSIPSLNRANPLKKLSISNKLDEILVRQPYYCAGCPHNSSTKASDGEIVGMGIGCHSISGFINPDTITNFTQMGGEGAFWIGRAPFSERTHSFQNMGDGTYAHSGYLGVRAAVAAGVNITFKMLVNDAVAMTGGQSAQGGSSPFSMTEQLLAEGVKKVVIVSDQPDQIRKNARWPVTVDFFHRDKILNVQDELSQIKGVSALLHVQTCATELRRRRKRKLYLSGLSVFILMQPFVRVVVIVQKVQIALLLSLNLMVRHING